MDIFTQKEIDDIVTKAVDRAVKESRRIELKELELMYTKLKFFNMS